MGSPGEAGVRRRLRSEGLGLVHRQWSPAQPARAVVAIIHGVCEYGGRYGKVVAPALTDSGFEVQTIDLRGHGESEGERGHVESFEDYLEDLDHLVASALEQAQRQSIPLFLYGHSMGALILMDWLAHRDSSHAAGAIISAPPLMPGLPAAPWLAGLTHTMSFWWPTLAMSLPLGTEGLTRDPLLKSGWNGDPHMNSRVTVRWGAELLAAIDRVNAHAPQAIKLPVLLLHGTEDEICRVEGSQRLFETLAAADRTLRLWPGSRHEVHHDVDREQVLREIVQWIEGRLT
jgi:alpha-beta hydrolase superfamily lysophospholipase